jgi:hypothetical protein
MTSADDLAAWVLAYLDEHPASTARQIAAALGATKANSPERYQVHAALNRLRDRGRVEGSGYPCKWTVSAPPKPIHDAEYVEIVIERLGELWHAIPSEHRHAVEWCMVDLQRALGIIETQGGDPA